MAGSEILYGRAVLPDRVTTAVIRVEDGRIAAVEPCAECPAGVTRCYDHGYILPGLIDVHTHGIFEYGTASTHEIAESARARARFGTTGFLPTDASRTEEGYCAFAGYVRQARQQRAGGARVLGAHFEGPFINPVRKGGMDEQYLRPMDEAECGRYLEQAGDVLSIMTLSPELPGSEPVIRMLRQHGVTVALGHSDADEHQVRTAIKAGLTHVVHLFNTFLRTGEIEPGMWKPSLAEYVLTEERLTCELICDMVHVQPTFLKLAMRVLKPDRFVAITDSVPGAGYDEGEYALPDGRAFRVVGGVGRLVDDDLIVGSVITMNRALRNLVVECDVDMVTAVRCCSLNPARVLGMDDRFGSIEASKCADLAVLDDAYECVATFVDGECVYER